MIYITGDTHGEFQRFSGKRFEAGEDDYLIICGDFGGVWDRSAEQKYWLDWLAAKPWTTLFLDGNHENYDLLATYPVERWHGGKVQYIRPKLLHLMRGQVFVIDGLRFFVMGGASSHDVSSGILEPDDPDFNLKRRRLDRVEGGASVRGGIRGGAEEPRRRRQSGGRDPLPLRSGLRPGYRRRRLLSKGPPDRLSGSDQGALRVPALVLRTLPREYGDRAEIRAALRADRSAVRRASRGGEWITDGALIRENETLTAFSR